MAPELLIQTSMQAHDHTARPQRAAPRAPALWAVTLWGTDEADGVCLNVSLGGMALAVPSPLPVDTLVRVSAIVPGLGAIHITAVVVWSRADRNGGRVGLRFLQLSPEALVAVNDHVAATAA